MKLILCKQCKDVFRPWPKEEFECKCGQSWATMDEDNFNMVIAGEAVPLSIVNESLILAQDNRPESGTGSYFLAFVIPRKSSSVRYASKIEENKNGTTTDPVSPTNNLSDLPTNSGTPIHPNVRGRKFVSKG